MSIRMAGGDYKNGNQHGGADGHLKTWRAQRLVAGICCIRIEPTCTPTVFCTSRHTDLFMPGESTNGLILQRNVQVFDHLFEFPNSIFLPIRGIKDGSVMLIH